MPAVPPKVGPICTIGLGAMARTPCSTKVELAGAVSWCSADAQQLSACAWLIARLEAEWSDSAMCIGHVSSSAQHAIRASGDDCHPAQTAKFPMPSATTAAIAARRLLDFNTPVECSTSGSVSNRPFEEIPSTTSWQWCEVLSTGSTKSSVGQDQSRDMTAAAAAARRYLSVRMASVRGPHETMRREGGMCPRRAAALRGMRCRGVSVGDQSPRIPASARARSSERLRDAAWPLPRRP